MDHDHHAAGKNASATYSSNSAANDESNGIRSSTADEGAEFEKGDGSQKDPFCWVKLVDSTVEELGRAAGEHVCAGVPADVAE